MLRSSRLLSLVAGVVGFLPADERTAADVTVDQPARRAASV
jgi:hypothetical protein